MLHVDRFDVLTSYVPPPELSSPGMLAETEDCELQRLVEEAARELGTPIALVTMLLDHIQFFKAHHGLPGALAEARGTHRDVSFCQIVVRDEEPLEIVDAAADDRIPQYLVDAYDIKAYLGYPIRVGEAVVGSLCVLDTSPRTFTDEERRALRQLAKLVNTRVARLAAERRHARLDLAERARRPALEELRRMLGPVREGVEVSHETFAALRSFLRLSTHAMEGGTVAAGLMQQSLEAAVAALEDRELAFDDLALLVADCEDSVEALDRLMADEATTRLSAVVTAAQDLARPVTATVGGAPLPDFPSDYLLYAPQSLAVAVTATSLMSVAAQLGSAGLVSGIDMTVRYEHSSIELTLATDGLEPSAIREVAADLSRQVGADPTLHIDGTHNAVRLAFAATPT